MDLHAGREIAAGTTAAVVPLAGFVVPDDARASRDAVIEQLTRRGGRLREKELIDTGHPRWTFPGRLPVRCNGM